MQRHIPRLAIVAAVSALAGPAFAADPYKLPPGCTAYATAQLRNCQVSHHYRCQGDGAGEQWSVYLDGEGAHFASKIDSETRWLESIDIATGESDRLGSESDPASFSTLLRSGRDDFDFLTTSSTGEVRRYTGFDQLTGQKVTIDGVELEQTKFQLRAEASDGSFLWSRAGQQYISRDWRIFYSDKEDFENSFGDKVSTVDTPVEFAFPGDKGFLTSEPIYDCDVVTARLDTAGVWHLPQGETSK